MLISFVLVSACTKTPEVPQNKYCVQDGDCLPATCCHAADAVNSMYEPDCGDVLCSQECQPETLDCGQGEVRCVNNECSVLISEQ